MDHTKPLVAATLLLLAGMAPLHGVVVFEASDSGNRASVGTAMSPAEVGDTITLSGTERLLTQATVYFIKPEPGTGSGAITLRFFEPGSPVGASLGSFTQSFTNVSGFTQLVFPNLNLVLPNTVAVSVSVSAPNLYTVPFRGTSVGSTGDTYFTSPDGINYNQFNFAGILSVPVRLEAVAVPEPTAATLIGFSLVLGALNVRRRRRTA